MEIKGLAEVGLLIWSTTGIRVLQDRGKQLHRKQCAKTLAVKAKEKNAILLIGGARGWDWEVMTYAYEMETQFKLYLPFKDRLDVIPTNYLHRALDVWYPFVEYNIRGYQVRNVQMVNDSSVLDAYWDGRKCWEENGKQKCSGTWNCINYALSQGKKVLNWYNVEFTEFDHAL
jgi:hypothetical protein